MKRTALVLAIALAVCAAGPILAQSPPPAGKIDLVITNFGFDSMGTCASGQWVYRFSVFVKNQGSGTWSGVEPAIVVKDMHLPNPDDWGSGLGISPPLKAGETRQFKVDVVYYAANPVHMTGGAPHPFRASVNDNHAVAESDFTNNLGPGPVTWNGMKVIQMGAPERCPKAITGKPGISTSPATGGRAPAPPVPTRP